MCVDPVPQCERGGAAKVQDQPPQPRFEGARFEGERDSDDRLGGGPHWYVPG